MGRKGLGTLIVTLAVAVLIGGAVGQLLGMFLSPDHIVARALVQPLLEYTAGPWDLNLIILVVYLGFSIDINFFSILGILGAWYYHKYSY